MKATGIIRRLDDLGRIVIPKEIRRTLRLHEGDPMEIYVDNSYVLFKKYDPSIIVSELLKELREAVLDTSGLDCNPVLLEKIKDIQDILVEHEKKSQQ